jgi:GTP-binding protein
VVADIPGLIEGAHQGAGLGDRFLRHVERCRLLLHLVDPVPPERDPVDDAEVIDRELAAYSPELARKPRIVVVTKRDALQDDAPLRRIEGWARERGFACHCVSAVSGEGIAALLHATADALDSLPRAEA